MARHQISAAKPKPEKPKAAIGPAPSSYETTHPVGSAERFLDQAARDALAAAAALTEALHAFDHGNDKLEKALELAKQA